MQLVLSAHIVWISYNIRQYDKYSLVITSLKGTVMVGVSKYGLWLSRKKPAFIPDPPKTTTMINQPTSEEEENSGNTNNSHSNSDDMKLEPRSAAFVSNQPSRLSQQQQQEQQQREQQQPPQQQVYPYSVKIEQSSSGAAKVSVHTYNVNPNAAKDEAVRLFIETREELKSKGLKVLEQQQND